eukprot:CAMPEP_0180647356 /NCGR_PEP_ID=MMETSP1037_2-20121125/50264_1 /TAXON_ID=632150 /ORGANISM="Azadinium spinosum, Strain 3D9" /LENGTH=33 /DNA_ID= /DNA_START= /DNA_END= /DNA_ORIENTATION=
MQGDVLSGDGSHHDRPSPRGDVELEEVDELFAK